MAATLHLLYPITDGTTFDYNYYTSKHMEIVGNSFGKFIESTLVAKGLAGGPDVPSGFHAIASMTFKDMDALQQALDAAGPALADIPNFTNTQPVIMIGEQIG